MKTQIYLLWVINFSYYSLLNRFITRKLKIISLIYMSERKGSLHLTSNNNSNKYINPNSNKHQKGIKHRGSFAKQDQNSYAQFKEVKPSINSYRPECPSFLVEKSLNIPEPTSGYSSYRNSLQQSLLSKLRKLGYVSNNNSKQNSPQKKRKSQNPLPHKRNFSSACDDFVRIQKKIEKPFFNKALFDYKNVIGKGGFGKVWKVELKRNKKVYAMKQMSKALIIAKKSVPSVMNEKKLLASLKNEFIVNMVQAFQDRETLFLVMDYLPGGDLRHHIAKKKKFTEQEARFIIACILLGLEYLHKNNIIHRDIKPENIVLDEKGYARITDLGVARYFRHENSSDTSGTPGYMAPEVLCRQNHSFSVDHFALGVIAYELMLRRRPYYGRNRKQIRDQILARQVQIKKNEIPDDWSLESADFINRLIQRKPNNRLGFRSSQQIMNHPWMRKFAFKKIEKREYKSPYIPDIQVISSWSENRISSENTQTRQLIMQNQVLLRDKEVQNLFNGYESI